MKIAQVTAYWGPNYLPWLGLFSKIAYSDCFIIVGDVQYTTNSMINRNTIRTKNGWEYFNDTVGRKMNGLKIYGVPLPRGRKWMENHWKAIKQNYIKADFLGYYQDFFEKIISGGLRVSLAHKCGDYYLSIEMLQNRCRGHYDE